MEVVLEDIAGAVTVLQLEAEAERQCATLFLNGVPHHLERIRHEDFVQRYKVDEDLAYEPMCDSSGYCFVIVPFGR